MIIPKKIKAFGRVYKVIRSKHVVDAWGFVDFYKDEIAIRERCEEFTKGHELQVFLHELIHLVDNNLKIGLDEKQTQQLAVGLLSIILDNKLDFLNNE